MMNIEIERRITVIFAAIFAALHTYKSEHGRWPTTLDELEFPSPAIQIDPFSGRQFRYELRDGQPWLYSVGLDGVDNGGRHHAAAAGSDRATGYDYVFLPIQERP